MGPNTIHGSPTPISTVPNTCMLDDLNDANDAAVAVTQFWLGKI